MRWIIIYRERKKERRRKKCEENRMSQSDLRIRELSCRYVRMKNKNRKDVGYLSPAGKKSFNTKTEIDELLFAVRTSSPSEARVNRPHRQTYLLYSMKEKKGQRVGGSGCSSRKGLSLKETLFQPFLLRLPLCRRNGYVYWVVHHLNELSMCRVILRTTFSATIPGYFLFNFIYMSL